MKRLSALVFTFMFVLHGFSQVGGRHAYEFLNLVSSPRVAALGGKLISLADDDPSLVYHNPSLLNESMYHHLALNYVDYFADVKYGYIAFAQQFHDKNSISVGIQYINYGTFIAADPTGEITGTFKAAEYAFNIAFARPLTSYLTIGADARPILSIYEHYQSCGLSTDFGLTYHNPEKFYTLALVARNLGTQIKPYYGTAYESLPFELQFGYTQEFQYAPFRISITAHHLELPDMSVPDLVDENQVDNTEVQTVSKKPIEKIADLAMRHLIFGAEFYPIKNFFIRGGYNYQRRQELKIPTSASTVGFSWGFGLTIYRFQINYGRATYHLAGSSDHFSVTTDLSTFYKKTPKTKE
jgi:hypothetical protein